MFFFRKSAVLRVLLTRFMNYMFLYPFEYRARFESNCYTDWRPIHIVFYTNPTPTPTWACLWQYRSRELKTLRSLCCWVNFFWSFSSEPNWKFSLRRTFCRMRLWRWRFYCVFIGINCRFEITNVWPGPSKNNVNVVEISKILGSWQSVNVRVVDKCVNWILKVISGQETSELRANKVLVFDAQQVVCAESTQPPTWSRRAKSFPEAPRSDFGWKRRKFGVCCVPEWKEVDLNSDGRCRSASLFFRGSVKECWAGAWNRNFLASKLVFFDCLFFFLLREFRMHATGGRNLGSFLRSRRRRWLSGNDEFSVGGDRVWSRQFSKYQCLWFGIHCFDRCTESRPCFHTLP